MSTVRTKRLRHAAFALVICLALAMPSGATALPTDNGPGARSVDRTAAPVVRTITTTENSGQTLAVVLAGVALLVAMTSAGYTVLRVGQGGSARRVAH